MKKYFYILLICGVSFSFTQVLDSVKQDFAIISIFNYDSNPENLDELKYELAICSIFQDDAKYLKEWIEFHEKQGVQKFYLYNNLSKDNYIQVLFPYIERGLVKVIEWPFAQKNLVDWNDIQCKAYMDCISKIKNSVKWCAFIDTDEYLFCPNGMKLDRMLQDFKDFGGVSANWMLYGTSNIYKIPEGKKMTDCLTYRAEDSHKAHFHVKTIVQPRFVNRCINPHFFIYKNRKCAVTENKVKIDGPFSPTVSVNHLRINHYSTRDGEFFNEVKIPRQMKWNLTADSAIATEKECHGVYDPLSKYVQ
jgi:hypothetical protein